MMEAGRELDALVAEKVMGCTTMFTGTDGVTKFCGCRRKTSWDDGAHENSSGGIKRYSTDIGAAWEVVEKITTDRNLKWSNDCIYRDPNDGKWAFGSFDRDGVFYLHKCDTAPHAICLAALKVVGAL